MRFISFCVIACVWLCACDSTSQQRVKLKTKQDSVSYANGVMLGQSIKKQEIDFDINMLAAGIKEAIAGKQQLTDEQLQAVISAWQQDMMAKQQEKMTKKGEANKKKSDEFLAANKKQPGVTTTASGLQYKVITSGSGASPNDNSIVVVHYKGTLIDGTEFDSSHKNGKPLEYPANGFIKGWTEALKLMKVGDKWQLFIPTDLAYGLNAPPNIGPNQALIFEMELLEVKAPPAVDAKK